MADAIRAAENASLDPQIRRLVIWASVDAWVQAIEFPAEERIEVHRLRATHLSVVLQPNVHRLVRQFLTASSSDACQTVSRAGLASPLHR